MRKSKKIMLHLSFFYDLSKLDQFVCFIFHIFKNDCKFDINNTMYYRFKNHKVIN